MNLEQYLKLAQIMYLESKLGRMDLTVVNQIRFEGETIMVGPFKRSIYVDTDDLPTSLVDSTFETFKPESYYGDSNYYWTSSEEDAYCLTAMSDSVDSWGYEEGDPGVRFYVHSIGYTKVAVFGEEIYS